jgi:hypothetical protein
MEFLPTSDANSKSFIVVPVHDEKRRMLGLAEISDDFTISLANLRNQILLSAPHLTQKFSFVNLKNEEVLNYTLLEENITADSFGYGKLIQICLHKEKDLKWKANMQRLFFISLPLIFFLIFIPTAQNPSPKNLCFDRQSDQCHRDFLIGEFTHFSLIVVNILKKFCVPICFLVGFLTGLFTLLVYYPKLALKFRLKTANIFLVAYLKLQHAIFQASLYMYPAIIQLKNYLIQLVLLFIMVFNQFNMYLLKLMSKIQTYLRTISA